MKPTNDGAHHLRTPGDNFATNRTQQGFLKSKSCQTNLLSWLNSGDLLTGWWGCLECDLS